jgi:hypothetical protein
MAPFSPLSRKARGGGRWERKHYLPNFSEFVADTNESATTRYKHLFFACMQSKILTLALGLSLDMLLLLCSTADVYYSRSTWESLYSYRTS